MLPYIEHLPNYHGVESKMVQRHFLKVTLKFGTFEFHDEY